MAKRSREHRPPGYDESRPTRDERKKKHRATRHATHQMLHAYDDPEGIVLPEERRSRKETGAPEGPAEPEKRRFKVWKTKFWKRRDDYRTQKAEVDSQWPVITPEQLPEEPD